MLRVNVFRKKSLVSSGEKNFVKVLLLYLLPLQMCLLLNVEEEVFWLWASPGGPRASDWQRTHTHT